MAIGEGNVLWPEDIGSNPTESCHQEEHWANNQLLPEEAHTTFVCLFVCLGFNSTFSTNRLYHAIIKVGEKNILHRVGDNTNT